MRMLLKVYRYIAGAVFLSCGAIFIIPMLISLLPGYTVEGPASLRAMLIGICVVLGFLGSGLAIIGLAIYDELRTVTGQVDELNSELQRIREATRSTS